MRCSALVVAPNQASLYDEHLVTPHILAVSKGEQPTSLNPRRIHIYYDCLAPLS